ncbi:MAG: cytidine deaminase [Opitutaceae bacterium]|nr:cytidine deaminase [Opitutaceae bacterium]
MASQQVSKSANQQSAALARQPNGLSEGEIAALIAAAAAVRERAYAPYSRFSVGAALRAADGRLFAGCNVENASYGLTICAERNAIAQAIAAGTRDFTAVAVVSENGVTPCGACRQVLVEFGPGMMVIVVDIRGRRRIYTLAELLLDAFGPRQLPGD